MTKERQIAYVKHPVSAEKKQELVAKGFKIIDARFKPEDAEEIEVEVEKIDLGTDSGDQFSDEQLRDMIEQETGERPHHKTGRAKLVETFNKLNAEADDE